MRTRSGIFILLIAVVASAAWGDFTPPGDGKLTEKQITSYIAIKKEQYDAMQSASKAAEGTQSSSAGLAIYANMSNKMDAAITSHGMTKEEFNWVDGLVNKLWYIAMWQQQWDDTGKPDLEKQIKAKEDERDAAKATLAQYEQAQKDGTRVLSKEQRETAVQSATTDQDSAADEVKTHEGEVKSIKEELAQHDKEAADADGLAKSPPAEVTADDRQSFIDQKKNDAQTARDASKDAQDRLKEAQKNLEDSKAKLAAINGQVEHPEIPVTDDDKAQVKQQNEQAITDAKQRIDGDEQAIKALKETIAGGPPMLATLLQDPKEKPDPDNLALVKKHIKEYLAAIGNSKMLENK